MRYQYRIMVSKKPLVTHDCHEPAITVVVVSRKGEADIAHTIRSASRVLAGHRWSLVVLVYGSHDDAGGVAKREMTTAYRVAVYQFPDDQHRRAHMTRAIQLAKFLRHECEFFTVLQAGDILFDGFVRMLRFARQHNHQIILGACSTTAFSVGQLNCWPFTNRGPAQAVAAFAARADAIPEIQCASDDYETDFWLSLETAGIAPAGYTEELVMHARNDARSAWVRPDDQADTAWVRLRLKRLNYAPGCLVIMASGQRSLAEAHIAARSCRNACDDQIPITVVTDRERYADVEAWGMDLVTIWDVQPFRRMSDAAMEYYRGPDHLRELFRSVLCRPAIAAEALSRNGSCVMADSDILFTRPFGPLPRVAAAAPKSFPWQMCGSYTEMHQWGIVSAGVMWFPPGSHGFVRQWEQATIQNASLYRNGRSTTSAPGGSAFCEQDAFDRAGMVFPSEPLSPAHNVTPSALGDYCPILAEFGGSGPEMLNALSRLLGITVHEGIWRNGWPVRSLHCHWGGNQAWNGLFEDAMIDCLEASGCAELVKLLSATETNPGSKAR